MAAKSARFDQPGSLMAATLKLLQERDLFEVFAETRIPYYWLKTFAGGMYRNPGVNRVQFLYEHLSGTKILGEE